MALLEVDPASLGRVATHLTESVTVAHEINKHHKRMAAHAEHAGDPQVVAALSSFLGKWSYGCGCLVKDAHGIAESLGSASAVYIRTDDGVARGISGGR